MISTEDEAQVLDDGETKAAISSLQSEPMIPDLINDNFKGGTMLGPFWGVYKYIIKIGDIGQAVKGKAHQPDEGRSHSDKTQRETTGFHDTDLSRESSQRQSHI